MLKHIVLFKIKDEFKGELDQLVQNFLGMRGKVPGLIDLYAGKDFLFSERSYDLGLICTFEDRASFDGYQTHPAHQPVRKRMHEVRESSVACDFLIEN